MEITDINRPSHQLSGVYLAGGRGKHVGGIADTNEGALDNAGGKVQDTGGRTTTLRGALIKAVGRGIYGEGKLKCTG